MLANCEIFIFNNINNYMMQSTEIYHKNDQSELQSPTQADWKGGHCSKVSQTNPKRKSNNFKQRINQLKGKMKCYHARTQSKQESINQPIVQGQNCQQNIIVPSCLKIPLKFIEKEKDSEENLEQNIQTERIERMFSERKVIQMRVSYRKQAFFYRKNSDYQGIKSNEKQFVINHHKGSIQKLRVRLCKSPQARQQSQSHRKQLIINKRKNLIKNLIYKKQQNKQNIVDNNCQIQDILINSSKSLNKNINLNPIQKCKQLSITRRQQNQEEDLGCQNNERKGRKQKGIKNLTKIDVRQCSIRQNQSAYNNLTSRRKLDKKRQSEHTKTYSTFYKIK